MELNREPANVYDVGFHWAPSMPLHDVTIEAIAETTVAARNASLDQMDEPNRYDVLTERLCSESIIAVLSAGSIQKPRITATFVFDPNRAHIFPETR